MLSPLIEAGEITNLSEKNSTIFLPAPNLKGSVSLEEIIYNRRSIRKFNDRLLSLDEIGQLLWAAGGKTVDGLTGATRSYPSAGGLYPLNIYLMAGNVSGLACGLYRYDWKNHSLTLLRSGDLRFDLARAALGQSFIASAPISLIITGDPRRGLARYGKRATERYLPLDAGHAGQNISLQAQALRLGNVMVGAFDEDAVKTIINSHQEIPLYIIPVGKTYFHR